MDDIERAVRDAFGALRAPAPAPARVRDTDSDREDDSARTIRVPRKAIPRPGGAGAGRDGYDRVKRTHPDIGKFADYTIDGRVVLVRIASIAGMSGLATVQRVDTRETLSVDACDLMDRRDVA